MTERGLPIVDGAPACPFVAFEDDRDERATSPDHRHRCYAEIRPAPRALAHQEAYCLSSAFPVCPTFQDWARREAARARQASEAGGPPQPAEPQRNPPRDWSAPPPWLEGEDEGEDDDERTGRGRSAAGGPAGAGAGAAAAAGAAAGAAGLAAAGGFDAESGGASEAGPPDFLAPRAAPGAGLAGSRADRMAGAGNEAAQGAPDEAAYGRSTRAPAPYDRDADEPIDEDEEADDDDWAEEDSRAGRGAARAGGAGRGFGIGDRRPRVGQTRRREPESRGPAWERPRRYEAYPTIKTRVGMSGIPRLGVMAAAIVVAALALFFLPGLLPGIGGPDTGSRPTATPSAGAPSASADASPTAPPAPTPQVYTVKAGDTLSKIARRFNVSLDDLITANKETLPDPDKLQIGDQLIIPTAGGASSAEPSASAAP